MNYPKRKSHLAYNQLLDQLVIINFKTENQFHQSNEVGAAIWNLCDGKHSFNEITESIFSEFDENIETIKHDTLQFLTTLKENDLLDI